MDTNPETQNIPETTPAPIKLNVYLNEKFLVPITVLNLFSKC
jgi:hypothetical protein